MKTRYDNVTVDPDRHGKLRARYRRTGAKPVYMKTLPDQPGFEVELEAIRGERPTSAAERFAPRSVHDLCVKYYIAADFRAKGGAEDRKRRKAIIEGFRAEYGNDLVANFGFEHIEAILLQKLEKRKNDKGRLIGGQVAATSLRKQLLRLFAYAKKLKWIADNPVADSERVGVKKIKGYHPWSEDDITAYKRRHPIGTKARLALEIILWTGQRRGDARLFGPKHMSRGKVNFVASKNKADVWLPMAPDLRTAIDAMPSVGITTYLVTEYGAPFSKSGFGNKMREWCDQAGLPLCGAHGLRKAIARRMAMTKATQQGIKAVGSWKGDAEVATYIADAEQESLADDALGGVIARFTDGGVA